MNTRKDYLEGRCDHAEYYGELVETIGVKFTNPRDIELFKHALETDPHMNNISLSWWDAHAVNLMATKGAAVKRALKERGDFYSMASGVCILKEAARKAVIA